MCLTACQFWSKIVLLTTLPFLIVPSILAQTTDVGKQRSVDIAEVLDPLNLEKFTVDEWNPAFNYYAGDLASLNGLAYRSIIDNVGKDPLTSPGSWKLHKETKLSSRRFEIQYDSAALFSAAAKLGLQRDEKDRIKIDKSIRFENCRIDYLELKYLDIEGEIIFDNCDISLVLLNYVNVDKITFLGGSGNPIKPIRLYGWLDTTISPQLTIGNMERGEILIDDLRMNTSPDGWSPALLIYESNLATIRISDPADKMRITILDTKIGGIIDDGAIFSITTSDQKSERRVDLEIANSQIGFGIDSSVVSLHSNFRTISIDSTEFRSHVNFLNSDVDERMTFKNCVFGGLVSFSNFTFPGDILLRWDQLGGERISRFVRSQKLDRTLGGFVVHESFIPSRNAGVENRDNFEDIMKSYQVLYNNYKVTGDIESANQCYSEMKDVQTRRLKYLFGQQATFQSFFRWQLALLMKFYANHGTDPARAIVVSVWVVMLFGIFYFFFPSDWDTTSKAKLISRYKDFIEKNEKGYVKPFFALGGGFLVSLLNAMTLSLNSFITLGFGTIPTHGIAKYFCVIEGFIGWFLLSIFTVALINQVLA